MLIEAEAIKACIEHKIRLAELQLQNPSISAAELDNLKYLRSGYTDSLEIINDIEAMVGFMDRP